MSLSQEALFDLMAYADGELEGEARARVESMIEERPEAKQYLMELATLGECVRVTQASRRVPKTVDHIASDVMKEIARQPRLVVNNDAPVVRWRRALATASISVALAAAAGWLLFLQARGDKQDEQIASATATDTAPAPPTPVAPPPSVAGVDLDNVESPHHEVSVFFVPSVADENASSVVVWVGGDSPGKAP